MTDEKGSLDAVLSAFKTYQTQRRKDTKAKLARIKTLREAVEAESARLRASEA